MKWKHLPIVAFDTETTGLEPFGGDRVIELAAVVLTLDAQGRVVERRDWSKLINPERDIPRKVTEITGIDASHVASAPRFEDVAEEVRDLLASGVTIAHNYPFDLAFLTREFDEVNRRTGDPRMRWPEPLAEVDTVDLSLRCFPEARSHKLSDLAERTSVQLERAHRATDDAEPADTRSSSWSGVTTSKTTCSGCSTGRTRSAALRKTVRSDPTRTVGSCSTKARTATSRSRRTRSTMWMDKARIKVDGEWRWRFSDSVRRWVRRWLEVRGAGRARQGQKGFHASDWTMDPCIALPRGQRDVLENGFDSRVPAGLASVA